MKKNNKNPPLDIKRFAIALAQVVFYFGLIVLAFMAVWHFGTVP